MNPRHPEAIWHIDKLVPGGEGLARLADGSVGFAAGVLPGEHVEVVGSERKKGFVRATRLRVVTPAAERCEPPCVYARDCGGCDFMHIRPERQLDFKAGLIREALSRTGGFAEFPDITLHPSPKAQGYRVRLRVHLQPGGRVGFFSERSHHLVPIEACLMARPELNAALAQLRRIAAEHPKLAEAFGEAELRVAPAREGCVLRLVPRANAAGGPRKQSSFASALAALEQVFAVHIDGQRDDSEQTYSLTFAAESAAGEPQLEAIRLQVPASAFVQVNWEVNCALVEHIVGGALERRAKRFLDLYSGVGNFTLPLARAGLGGEAVEANRGAAEAARRGLAASNLPVEVRAEPAEQFVQRLATRVAQTGAREPFDLVVLDPPRAGARDLIEALARLAPRFIAYCACDPVTLARDLKSLCAGGYALDSIHAFDMFPGTHHVETLVWLRRM
ncbi:MAG TPA: 23S rRNA (uracil(1939)-C(5))-methyltransferase RlmD [Polyangiaceae bacterium]|nr:23S rRNA (uracil(1939)-C(5))-methyltransferase RlmD [Polyangiaceae bacterium]